MPPDVLCRCKSHCTRYDVNTHTYVGPGVRIPSTTARRHALEDQRIEALGNFVGQPQSYGSPHSHISPPPHPEHTQILFERELSTLRKEITERSAWSPADRLLVFAVNPGPMQEFTYPKTVDVRVANHGPHALDPANHANTAYIENESRLCEILVHLHELVHPGGLREQLEEGVYVGLSRMWKHKEAEWHRRRYQSVAIHHGFSVVHTGTPAALDGGV